MQEIQIGKLYKHYKGNIYKIINIGQHSETLEKMIIYQSEETGEVWIRPYKMWNEIVDTKNTLRFTIIE